jgi:hypothetical protein
MKAYVGIDLHSTNSFIGIIDENNNKLFLKKLPNNLEQILLVPCPVVSYHKNPHFKIP